MRDALFVTDGGGFYRLFTIDGILHVQGMRTTVTYRSEANRVEVRGKVRQHTGVGTGQRAILHLDTGEGMSAIPGVFRADQG